ncbi:ATP-binding protein [Streptomyces sp. NBC_01478]|uniref:ATP-binding protein n=1 Tax=Streptomyces sp. NBC_01478 TaxID=2903882 RepID=UPI002E34B507|nr:ATP-binding protein [Streptomyces sp. NBC_01478]
MSDSLLKRLALLRDRVSALVEARSAGDPSAGEPLRGLYVSAERVEHLLEGRGRIPVQLHDAYEGAEPDDALAELAVRFGLTLLDTHILLTALAPDVDRDFEPLYGYLNDDVGRRRASVALALDLAGLAPHDWAARARFHPGAPLPASGLLALEDTERPLPGRALRVPERVIAHLLGDEGLDGELLGAVELLTAEAPTGPFASRLGALLADHPAVVHLRGRGAESGTAVEVLRAAGLPVLRYDPAYGDQRLVPVLLREARLRRAGVVVGPLPERAGALVRELESSGPVPVVLFGTEPFDPRWSADGDVLCLDAPTDTVDTGLVWAAQLGREAREFDLPAAVAPYRLASEQIRRAAKTARTLAVLDGGPLTAAHVQRGARQQSAPALDRHARRVSPAVGWTDLVLPVGPREQLEELVVRARQRERVLGQWGLRTGGGRGHGVVALFAGESGTGKTLAAEVVAGELGVDLYVVELSAVVDKYVGETEKNLERIFADADRTDAVLLFDEADAVFGKRSEVKEASDRYANLESAYLLQRLESFDGIAVLTTNLRANIDDAFTRRLDLVVDFPFPDTGQRLALWWQSLAGVPCADGIDPGPCARDFVLAGGSIRGAVITAAYAAAGRGGPVTTDDLLTGAVREYRKAGRLVVGRDDF